MLADIEQKNMSKESAILVRIFKEESELEVWKQDRTGHFALLKTYPICRWSGELGPKIKQGDRQAPEGFYTITPGQMNPNSNYYLAINTGFPNAYDRANGRTGAFLMIHGDCSSSGCYAMTDEQIAEIYSLARESFFGGQKSFQIQAYPFHMTPANMAKHRNSPNMAFWKMLKQGHDHFAVTRLEPKVNVCERHYVFDGETKGKFSASDPCPPYRVPAEIASAVREKQYRDEIQTAELINRGVPTAPVKTGVDGGMNKVFLAALRKEKDFIDADGRIAAFNPPTKLPGTIPPHVNPPREPASTGSTGGWALASSESKPAPAPSSVQVASAGPTQSSGGFFGNLFSFGHKEEPPPAAANVQTAKPKAAAKPAHPTTKKPTQTATAAAALPAHAKPRGEARPANVKSANAAPARTQEADATPPGKPEDAGLLRGAAPTVQSNGFENRFGGWR